MRTKNVFNPKEAVVFESFPAYNYTIQFPESFPVPNYIVNKIDFRSSSELIVSFYDPILKPSVSSVLLDLLAKDKQGQSRLDEIQREGRWSELFDKCISDFIPSYTFELLKLDPTGLPYETVELEVELKDISLGCLEYTEEVVPNKIKAFFKILNINIKQ